LLLPSWGRLDESRCGAVAWCRKPTTISRGSSAGGAALEGQESEPDRGPRRLDLAIRTVSTDGRMQSKGRAVWGSEGKRKVKPSNQRRKSLTSTRPSDVAVIKLWRPVGWFSHRLDGQNSLHQVLAPSGAIGRGGPTASGIVSRQASADWLSSSGSWQQRRSEVLEIL